MYLKFEELLGKTIVSIDGAVGNNEINIILNNGEKYRLFHDQDCCESVEIESIVGDFQDLIGEPILLAEEIKDEDLAPKEEYHHSYTWTFYKLATRKGYVDIRWYGTSNGYYSESVYFEKVGA